MSRILRNIFGFAFPIKNSEFKIFASIATIMLFMLFNFSILRSIKDSLVVPNIGAEAISFLKLWLVLPTIIVIAMLYVKLSNIFTSEKLFYIIVSFFSLYFLLFVYVLLPNQDALQLDPERISELALIYPNAKWFIYIAGKWIYAVMYIFCDLWSVIVVDLLFWQYTNNIFSSKDAKRIYPIIIMIGNLGLVIAGYLMHTYSNILTQHIALESTLENHLSLTENSTYHILKILLNSIIFLSVVTMMLYYYTNRLLLTAIKKKSAFQQATIPTDTKTKLSFYESIQLLLKSKYIGYLTGMVFAYGAIINILEGPWKAKVKLLYPDTVQYLGFMGQFNMWLGVSCVVFALISRPIFQKASWKTAALITPYMLTCTGIIFFILIIYSPYSNFFASGFNPLYIAVVIGALQNILSRATKYAIFDATKEMAYIPLDLELKTKGKAVVEIMGIKLGKAFGSFLQSFTLIIIPSVTLGSLTMSIFLFCIFVILMCFWFWNVHRLNDEYQKILDK